MELNVLPNDKHNAGPQILKPCDRSQEPRLPTVTTVQRRQPELIKSTRRVGVFRVVQRHKNHPRCYSDGAYLSETLPALVHWFYHSAWTEETQIIRTGRPESSSHALKGNATNLTP